MLNLLSPVGFLDMSGVARYGYLLGYRQQNELRQESRMTDNVVPVGAFVLVEHFEHRERVEVYVRPERFVTRPNRGQVEEGEDSVGAKVIIL